MKKEGNFVHTKKAKAMYADARKIHLIEAVLKIEDEVVLTALETVLEKATKPAIKKPDIYDFVGIFSKKDTKEIKKAIKETAETIHADDWG